MSATTSRGAGSAPAAVAGARTTVSFTEEMLGHVTFGERDFLRGADARREGAHPLKFHLTITVPDIDHFVRDPRREAVAAGWVHCEALGGRLPVERGVFNLFVVAGPGVRRMLYRLWFRDGVGHPLTLTGYKLVRDDPGFDVWRDTTTLFTRVLRGHLETGEDEGADLVASGVLRIRLRDFARQLTTFRAGGPSAGARAGGLARFLRVFLGQLATVYLRKAAGDEGRVRA